MLNTRRLLIVVGISLCAFISTGCEPGKPVGPGGFCEPVRPVSVKIGQVWLVDETYTPADKAVEARMNEIVPKMRFDGVAFRDVVRFLQKTRKVNICAKWSALEQVGVDKDAKVCVDLTNVTFAKALRIILDDVGGVNPLDYIIGSGIITITTRDNMYRYTVTRIYDVSDLIKPKPLDAMPPPFSREVVYQPVRTSQESDDSAPINDLSSNSNSEWDDDDDDDDDDERLYGLMQIIRGTVDMNSWRCGESSGDIGHMMEFDGKLIITQTPKAHHMIMRLLAALREQTPTIPALPPALGTNTIGPQTAHQPTPENAMTKALVTVPPEKWPAGNKKTIVESVKIMGVDTSRIYVVFLLDCTGSMLDSLDDAVNKRIVPALGNLSSEQYFNVICFRGKITLDPFDGKLVQATADNKKKATTFLRERVHPEGQTSFLPALAKAYSAMDVANGSDSQVIFLLTDGGFPNFTKILNIVAPRSKHIKIPIHTYHYYHSYRASAQDAKSLKRLSEITDGEYRAISPE